ncbi:HNH endonuclease [Nocardioides daeguensis]|nr:HNH endonuclease [Nocardioides daeguensis]
MARTHSEQTIKILFGQARRCAYPGCNSPLIFDDADRGVRTPVAEIAHIRSASPDGPRHDPDFPGDQLNREGNLLLLCGTHHRAVDQAHAVFPVEELLEWKQAQVAQAGGSAISDAEIVAYVKSMESALQSVYEALQVTTAVDIVPARRVPNTYMTMSTDLFEALQRESPEQVEAFTKELIGVSVANVGFSGVDVVGAGLELVLHRAKDTPAPWFFPTGWSPQSLPHRLQGRSSAVWYAEADSARGLVIEAIQKYKTYPTHVRAFASYADGTREVGVWVPFLDFAEQTRLYDAERLIQIRSVAPVDLAGPPVN